MKKAISMMLATAMAATCLAGCGSAASSSAAASSEAASSEATSTATSEASTGEKTFENNELNIAVFEGGYGSEYWDEIIKRFEAAYPGVTVNMQISPKIGDIIRPQIVAGNVPDFISMNDNDSTGLISSMVKEHALMDLSDVFEEGGIDDDTPLKDQVIDGLLDSAKCSPYGDGKIYIAPFDASVLPAVILTLMFTIWPTAQALYLSFTNATSLGLNNKFVGLDNYIYMFHDKSFIQALINTAKLMAVVPVITIFCSLVLAFVLNQCKLKEMVLYRTLFYFPNIVSLTVVGIIWSFVFHPNVGIVNKILGAVGLESLQRSWLGDSKTALWCIAFTLLWQAAGYYMVMHIAAMDGISPEIYESATLDGASAWRKLISITMPLMKDIIGITFVLALSGTINLSFVLSQVMTGGGPNGASSVLLQYMYTQGFVNGNFGYAMAITVFTLAISVALSMLSRKLTDASEGGQ